MTYNCLKVYTNCKIGGLSPSQLKPRIICNNLYLGIEGNKHNLDNIKQYIQKLKGRESEGNDNLDQLEKELARQVPVSKLQSYDFISSVL